MPTDEKHILEIFSSLGPIVPLIQQIHPKLMVAISKTFNNAENRKKIRQITTDRNFANALRLLEPILSNTAYESDMHINNFMLRPDGHLVIIDPATRYFDEY